MRKRHILPLTLILVTALSLLWANRVINKDEGSERSGFVQVGSCLVNGAAAYVDVKRDCMDNDVPYMVTENTHSQEESTPISADNIGDKSPAFNWIGDTIRIADIIRKTGSQGEPDLSVLKIDYLTADNGMRMVLAQNQMNGIYLIQKSADQEMVLMNYFDRAMQVTFQEESHLGMPDIITTNYDMTLSFYVWDGTGYKLDHEGRWMCPA